MDQTIIVRFSVPFSPHTFSADRVSPGLESGVSAPAFSAVDPNMDPSGHTIALHIRGLTAPLRSRLDLPLWVVLILLAEGEG